MRIGEGHARARRALAVARQRGHGVERAGLGAAAVARDAAAHPVLERPAAPGDRQRGLEGRAGLVVRHVLEQPDDLARRRAVGAREPRAVGDARAQPEARIVRRTTAAPARVVPPAPNSSPSALISVSALKLSDGRLVRRAISAIVAEGCSASGSAARRVRPARRGAADHDVAALERALEGAGGEQRRPLCQ